MATPRKPVDIKQFRKSVALLKKKGLLKNVDARKARPEWIRGGRSLSERVKKYADVIDQKVEPVKVPPKKLRQYQRAGYETSQGKVLVPKLTTDKVTVTKEGEIQIQDKKSGIARIKKAVSYHNLAQWLRDMQGDTKRIDAMKKRNEYFGYKIAGHTSWNLYRSIEFLLEEIINGTTSGLNLSEKIRHTTHKQQNEFFESFEIVRVPLAGDWPEPPTRGRTRGGISESPKARAKYRKKQRKGRKGDEIRRQDAERAKRWRDSLKGRKLKEYKDKAKKRAKKSRKRA